jgi:aspartate kinase
MIIVSKFGGSSLADANQFKKVKSIIAADDRRKVIVVSAPGKSDGIENKITDLLYLLHAHLKYGVRHDAVFDMVADRFETIVTGLGLDFDIACELESIKNRLDPSLPVDWLVSRGEYLTAKILAASTGFTFVDAKDLIRYKYNSTLDESLTGQSFEDALKRYGAIVVPGFYGSYPNGAVHVMARGGSDLSGSIASKAVSASLYENWTDVSGIFMADPKIIRNPRQVKEITYSELRELAYMGADVLHESSVLPLQELDIPINIKNTNAPDDPGTLIKKHSDDNASVITGIAGRKDFTVFTVTKHTHAGKLETIRDVLEIFAKYKLKVEHIPSSIDGFSVIVNSKASSEVFFDLMADITQSEGISDVAIDRDMALISVVGRNMSTKPGIAGKLFSRIGASGININLIAQSSQEINIVVGVKNSDFEETIKAIYDAFVGKE